MYQLNLFQEVLQMLRLQKEKKVSGSNAAAEDSSDVGNNSVHEELDQSLNDQKGNGSQNSEGCDKGDIPIDDLEEPGFMPKQREIKGIEVSNALREAKTANKWGSEASDVPDNEGSNPAVESSDRKFECNGDMNYGLLSRPRRLFESVEDYVRVFEPLLFEECHAQLYSTWQELAETTSRDTCNGPYQNIERRKSGYLRRVMLQFYQPQVLLETCGATTSIEDEGDEVTGRVVDDDHILRKLQPRALVLTVLGSLLPATRDLNGPQLAAIQWAATHTAAGTNSGVTRKQEPWPFTLVQGPPGTAPESYKQGNENNPDNVAMGLIDEVLQKMDQNLFAAFQNSVLSPGFYHPDVARVGVDSQTQAAQAVSVERRTELLLLKNHDEILQHMRSLKVPCGCNFNLEEARANLEASFANEAEIVFPVSSSGRKLFSPRCVLVGDPSSFQQQSSARLLALSYIVGSLFERFQQAGCPTMLLSVQYRMHPQIRDFPSRYFYQGRLTDSESVANLPDEVYYKALLKPYLFYDVTHGRESHRGGSASFQNVQEAVFCLRLYEHLQRTIKFGFAKNHGNDLYINTVDAFQGQERDVIIMSCVRASSHGVGFVSDSANECCSYSARRSYCSGAANDWAALIADAKARNCYVDMDSLPKDFQKDLISKRFSRPRGLVTLHHRVRLLTLGVKGYWTETSIIRYAWTPGDRSRDAWQYGMQKWYSAAGVMGRKDS
ncbi:Detected protein of confused Function [Hibiscus syriacus]|uniref:Detected protein of confused Function n=1 Tax=Hibiscus syriacus TaxID=106335 RepID=A0A6A3B2I6_HIBSY|nr:Detected protein of confused Function [Hibiscus syriacus]